MSGSPTDRAAAVAAAEAVADDPAGALRRWRAAMGWATRPAAAEALGVSLATLRNWEQGVRAPDHPGLLRHAMLRLVEREG